MLDGSAQYASLMTTQSREVRLARRPQGEPGLDCFAFASGKLVNRETFVDGLDAAPAAFLDLLHSGAGNIGKMVVRLSG